jgi:hypothetical protein
MPAMAGDLALDAYWAGDAPVTGARAGGGHRFTSPLLRDLVTGPEPGHQFTLCGRPQSFFDSTSCSICLSSDRSATIALEPAELPSSAGPWGRVAPHLRSPPWFLACPA